MSDAHRYTHGHHDSVLRSHRWRTAENSCSYLLPELRPGLSLLDVGCGPGTITIGLARRVAPGRVVGIDASAAILEEASARVAEDGPSVESQIRVEWQVGDIYALPFGAGTFDVVHAHQVLQHLADPVAGLREMARVTTEGGLVAARDGDYAAMTWWPEEPGLDRWLEVYRAVARTNGGEPDAGRRLLAWAHEAGLNDLAATASAWCFAGPEEVAWWSTFGPSALLTRRLPSGRWNSGSQAPMS